MLDLGIDAKDKIKDTVMLELFFLGNDNTAERFT